MSNTKSNNTDAKPEELVDSDLDEASGGYTEVEWTYAKSESGGNKGQNSGKGGNLVGDDIGAPRKSGR